MPRLIDAEKLAEYKASDVSEIMVWQQGWNDAIDTIMNEEPTVDAVEVVRCKDCENWVENEHCLAWAYEYSDANGFCYLGKRRGLIGTQMSFSISTTQSERREDAKTN